MSGLLFRVQITTVSGSRVMARRSALHELDLYCRELTGSGSNNGRDCIRYILSEYMSEIGSSLDSIGSHQGSIDPYRDPTSSYRHDWLLSGLDWLISGHNGLPLGLDWLWSCLFSLNQGYFKYSIQYNTYSVLVSRLGIDWFSPLQPGFLDVGRRSFPGRRVFAPPPAEEGVCPSVGGLLGVCPLSVYTVYIV